MKVRRIDWHPADWLAGTRGLGWDETAAYITVINIIYDRGDGCPNDPAFIAGHLRRSDAPLHRQALAAETVHMRNVIGELVGLGKLHVSPDGQWLTNGRAEAELNKARERIQGTVRAGIASGRARRPTGVQYQSNASPRQGEFRQFKDLGRTSARNHQPPKKESDRENNTDAAREPAPDQTAPARAHAKRDPRLEALAAKARAKFMDWRQVTRGELLARARLLSAVRVARHGSPPADAGVWWQQVEALAAEFDMPITWAEWHSVTVSRETAQQEELL